jgi:2-phosphoglycolate phosphatase
MSQTFPSRLQAVVFDLDGTLLDTAPEFVAVVQQLRAEHDLGPLAETLIEAHVSDGARSMVSLALAIDEQDDSFEAKRLRFLQIYQGMLGTATLPYPGIPELLANLQGAGISWGISTNKPSYLTEPLVEAMAFSPPPTSIVCPDHVSQPKPHPEPLLLNCLQLQCSPHSVVYIGDHRRDIQAGRSAGMYTIAAAYGYIHQEDDVADWGAKAVAQDSLQLLELITRAFSE